MAVAITIVIVTALYTNIDAGIEGFKKSCWHCTNIMHFIVNAKGIFKGDSNHAWDLLRPHQRKEHHVAQGLRVGDERHETNRNYS